MPNQSGTVTSSMGAVVLGSSPNDTITFTPSSGTYTVEYPLGTVAINASSFAQTLTLTGGQLRITCVSGSVAYALIDAADAYVLSQAQTAAAQALVSGAGRSNRLGNVLTCGFLGRFTTAATSGNPHTSQHCWGLEADFDGVTLILPNSVTTAVTGVRATMSVGNQAGTNGSAAAIDPTASSGGTWVPATFSASFVGSIAAATVNTTTGALQAGTQLTVTQVLSGVVSIGHTISGSGVTGGTTITAFVSGVNGGPGIYTVSASQLVGSTTISATGAMTTLPAAASADAATFTKSDTMRCTSLSRSDGGTQPLLWTRVLIPGANANRPSWYFGSITEWNTEANVAGRIRRFRSQANTDGVTAGSEANFTTSSIENFNNTPVYVQYLSRKTGITVMVVGDSIFEGTQALSQRGWQFVGRDLVSTKERPIELCTVAIAGSNSTTWLARLASIIGTVNPDYVVIPAFEVNDQNEPMAGTGQAISRFNYQQAVKVATDNLAIPIVATGCPANETTGVNAKALGAGDSLRRAINADVRLLPNGRPWMDFDALMAGSATASGQVEFIAAYTTDGLHPNTVGHGVLGASAFAPMLRSVVAANWTA